MNLTRFGALFGMKVDSHALLERVVALPSGYSEGSYLGRRYGVTRSLSEDGRRCWLFAEELGGNDHVSCNIYRLFAGGVALRPCEMSVEKVARFIGGFVSATGDGSDENA